MKKSLKVGAVISVIFPAIVLFAAGVIWYLMGQPLYTPGTVRSGEKLRAPLEPPAQPADEHFWKVEPDIQLYHFSTGEGRNVLIVHGGPGIPYLEPWTGLSPLQSRYKFHYYDQRGSGQSSRPVDKFASKNYYKNLIELESTLGIGAQIADIERIRRILGDEKLIVVGHSFGAFLASLYAAEFPERVDSLVLIAPAPLLVMPLKDGGLFETVRRQLPADMQADYDAFLGEYLDFQNIFSRSETDLIALN
ncbi:MAG: alpha/beta hydrolase [Acidobacteria bacterium]|nr:alpha/beta hydrolase [Acidobacteriota bacterium]